jgi:peptidoglycan hydrolase-like protein with peptidoglycan-binding domain
MRQGAKNDAAQVKALQQFLKDKERLYTGTVSGLFDRATDTAVRAFQKKYSKEILAPWGHSTPTGYVYLTTSRKINALNCQ